MESMPISWKYNSDKNIWTRYVDISSIIFMDNVFMDVLVPSRPFFFWYDTDFSKKKNNNNKIKKKTITIKE